MIKYLLIVFSFLLINACSSSYKKLDQLNYKTNNSFEKILFNKYKEKAIYEAEEMHDWNSAKLYSEKALNSLKEKKIKPQEITYWKLSKNQISQLQISYDNLMKVYDKSINLDPYNLAVAVSSLDCWAEQQKEGWQTWDINKCKNDFLNSMHILYNKISNENNKIKTNENESNNINKNESVSVITKNEKSKIMQIIYFDFDESELSEISQTKIKNFINKNRNNISNFLIVGHADTKGTDEYNLKLSLKRAEEVKKILLKEEILEENITILGKGEKFLAVSTGNGVAHPANRRAEILPAN